MCCCNRRSCHWSMRLGTIVGFAAVTCLSSNVMENGEYNRTPSTPVYSRCSKYVLASVALEQHNYRHYRRPIFG